MPNSEPTQHGYARDTQRAKVYKAEHVLQTPKGSPELQDILAAQAYVDNVCEQAWFQRRWGRVRIKVMSGRGGGRAYERQLVIKLGTVGRQPVIILHEMAHVLAYMHNHNYSPHGPEFAGVQMILVEHVMGDGARWKLSDSYRKHRVRWNLKAVPEPTHAVVTKVERTKVKVAEKRQVRQQVAARKAREVAAKREMPTKRELAWAAEVIRRAVKNDHFGPSGRKPRTHALETARLLQ